MVGYIVDTSVWIDYFASRETWATRLLDETLAEATPVRLTDVILTELLQGARDDAAVTRLENRMAVFDVLRLDALDDFRRAAALRRAARRAGTPVRGTIDCLIASVCIRESVPLLHSNGDFDRLAACSDLRLVRR